MSDEEQDPTPPPPGPAFAPPGGSAPPGGTPPPPPQQPPPPPQQPPPPPPEQPPAPGWWKASDGNWYPPQTDPTQPPAAPAWPPTGPPGAAAPPPTAAPPPGGSVYYAPGATTAPSKGLSTWSLVLGIISIPAIVTCGFGILLGILAVIFGLMAKSRAREHGSSDTGRAQAGFITGLIGIVGGIAFLVFMATTVWSDVRDEIESELDDGICEPDIEIFDPDC